MATTKYPRAAVEAALKRHEKRVDAAIAIGCSPSYLNKLLDENYRDLKHLAKWRGVKKNKLWRWY